MSFKVYINGEFFDKEHATINVYDHGLLYGDGVFEGIRCYGGKVFKHKDHIDRLYESANAIALKIPMSKEDMIQAVEETLKINNLTDAYIRLVITRGVGNLGIDPNNCGTPQVIIITDKISLYPKELYENGLDIVTAGTIRTSPAAFSPRIKSLNYLNNIMAKIEGHKAGCQEALMLNHKGEVAECTGDNIFIIRKGEIITPSLESGILEGVTRNTLIDLARSLGYTVHERPLTRFDIYIADECFLTGTAAELIPVVTIDTRTIGTGKPGPITKRLIEEFHKITGK